MPLLPANTVAFCGRVNGMCGGLLLQVGRCVRKCDGRPWDWRDGGFRLSPLLWPSVCLVSMLMQIWILCIYYTMHLHNFSHLKRYHSYSTFLDCAIQSCSFVTVLTNGVTTYSKLTLMTQECILFSVKLSNIVAKKC